MKIGLALALLAGTLLAVGLVIHEGAADVLNLLLALGWGLAPMLGLHLIQLFCCALGWRPLVARDWPRPLGVLMETRWIREAVNGLLPVAHIGGEIVGARVLSFRGVRGDAAGASVVVDLTVEVATQVLFTFLGLFLLLLGGEQGDVNLNDLALAAGAAGLLVAGFVVAQRFGLFKLVEALVERLRGRIKWFTLPGFKGLHDAIQEVHRRPKALGLAAFWHLTAWLLGGIEVWIALHFMGVEVGARDALILESLGGAARAIGFAVPGGVGIQEGGFVLIGAMVGIEPDAALALSLAKRLRELAFGLPALALWQWIEGRRVIRARKPAAVANPRGLSPAPAGARSRDQPKRPVM